MSVVDQVDDRVENVVLLDESGHAIGTAAKSLVHHDATPLHLAFSCHIFDDYGRVLITQRALSKRSFPGIWTNSCCGHPAPGEDLTAAVHRRVEQELGVRLVDVRLLLPQFRYRAEQDGIVEYEICPVFVARLAPKEHLRLDAAEVEDSEWLSWPQFRAEVLSGSRQVSLWCEQQVGLLPDDPLTAPAADPDLLPPAVR